MRKWLIILIRVSRNNARLSYTRFASILLTVAAVLASIASQKAAAQKELTLPTQPNDVRVLLPDDFVRRRLDPNKTHLFRLTLEAQKFAQIVVDQRGTDALVRVKTPEGSLYREIDNPNGLYGPEIISILANLAGSYELEISSSSGSGDYELRVDGPRAATPSDTIRVAAERAFAEAQTLRAAGSASFEQALKKYNEAITLWRDVGDFQQQGYSRINIGRVYKALRQPALALESLDEAGKLLQQVDDFSGQAFALNEAGGVHRDLGDLRKALPLYDAALKLRLNLGDRYGQAQVYNNLGLTYSHAGYQPNSIESHEKALAIWRSLGIRGAEMNTLVNAAKAHVEMGDLEVARSQYQTVLDFCNTELSKDKSPLANDARKLKPFALNGLGLVHDTWADTDSALTNYHEALSLFRENNHILEEANVLDNIGLTYAFLGDPSQAIEYLQQALELRKLINQPRPWGMTLSNLGYAYTLLGEHAEAQKQLTLALPLSVETHDRRFEAYTLFRLGMTYVALHNPLKALEQYERALALQQEPDFEDRRGQAMTLDKMAEVLALSGKEAEALKKYESAIERWKFVGDGQGQALSLYGIARIERDRTNLANARDRVEEAIRIVENLRNRVTARQLQMTYFAGKQDLYALAIDVRMQLYDAKKSPADLEAALAFSEKARARNLLDLLSEARVDPYKDMSPKIAERSRRLERQISALTQNLVRFRGVNAKQDVADVQQKLDRHIKEHDRLLAPFKRAAARTHQTQPLSPKEMQQLLDDDTVLLQFSLDEKRSYLWAVTRTTIVPYYLPGGKEIEDTANQLRQALIDKEATREREAQDEASKRRQSATMRYRQSAAELSRLILTDVAPKLGNKRLVIVADGKLHYIPFETLPLPESAVPAQHAPATSQRPLLLLNNEIVYQQSASALGMLRRTRRPVASKKVAILADPVFNSDEANGVSGKNASKPVHVAKARLTRSLRDIGDIGNGDYTLPRLEYSLKEANAIAAVAPRGSMTAVGFKATRALATSPILKQFGFVHFATHGLLNEKNPELSGIVLSLVNQRGEPEDGYLTLRDIYNLDLPAHLVVVSACETGVSTPVRGEGLIGLTRGFMNAGAQSVVVSLWRVEDEATAELMKRFYIHMFGKEQLSPAAALRQAKVEMKDQYHPYQWAGFVLQGDWK